MLWLRRKIGDSIVIPAHDIEIVLLDIDGDTTKIGVDAPDGVSIYRREVWRAIQRDEGARVLGMDVSTTGDE